MSRPSSTAYSVLRRIKADFMASSRQWRAVGEVDRKTTAGGRNCLRLEVSTITVLRVRHLAI
eukprot:scaffold437_cov168-Ochromonas_danica.AAC.43